MAGNYSRRKIINLPLASEKLAEFIGLFLGDGSFKNKYQISISYNHISEIEYADYIQNLFIDIFNLETTRRVRKQYGSAEIVATSSNLVDFLKKELRINSIREKNKFILPEWIRNYDSYKKAFIRGLFDSEGCIYSHKYFSNNKNYSYNKIAITNYSPNILMALRNLLEETGFHPKLYHNRIHLYNQKEVDYFFTSIGTNNIKNKQRFKNLNGEVAEWLKATSC